MPFNFSSRAPLETLHPEMRDRAERWLRSCNGMDLLVYCTVRSAHEQAVLYRKNRSLAAIQRGAEKLRSLGMGHEAAVLLEVPPQPGSSGRRVTNALPGLSWHQPKVVGGVRGAFALDFVPTVGGKPDWYDLETLTEAGALAEEAGLTWSGRWTRFREMVHVQYDAGGAWDVVAIARGLYAGGVD